VSLLSWLYSAPRLALRWLLEIDRPVPALSACEIAAEVESNYPWNFTVNMLDVTTFWFSFSFISPSTIMPLFVSKLTSDPLPIGLIAVIAQSAWFLPQLFTANAVEQLARKKPVVVNLGLFIERVPTWIMPGAALLAVQSPWLALAAFVGGYAWHALGAGIAATAWQDLIARCFPVNRRGRFLGLSMFVGAGTAALGAGLSAWLLESFPFPTNFLYIFAIAAVGITISWCCIALTRETAQPVSAAHRQSNRQFWAGLPNILRQDRNFRRFFIARILLAMGGMGVGFVTVAAVQRWQVSDADVGIYTAALLAGQTVANLVFGLLADRFGHKLCLEIGTLASFVAFATAWLAPAQGWFFAVFVLLGIASGAITISGMLVVLEFCEPQRRPTYIGLVGTAAGLFGGVAPLLGVWLAGIGYDWLFAVSAAINLTALIALRWWVKEPRHAVPVPSMSESQVALDDPSI
jgi:MFS family permease